MTKKYVGLNFSLLYNKTDKSSHKRLHVGCQQHLNFSEFLTQATCNIQEQKIFTFGKGKDVSAVIFIKTEKYYMQWV